MAAKATRGVAADAAPLNGAALRPMVLRIAPVALSVAAGAVLAERVPGAAFLALAVVAGLPHGAFDHKVARRAFEGCHGAKWWQPFLAGYLILASAMLLAWWAFPLLALSIFLFLSVLHFGDQDASVKAPFRCLRILVHGGVPIVVSAARHPDAIERLLAALVPGQANVVATVLGGPLLMLWAAAAAVTLIAYAARGHADDVAAAADLILIALLFAVAPPLIAFSLYFAAIHAPRAFAAAIPAGGMQAGEIVVPAVLTMLALALGAVIFAVGAGPTIEENVVRTAFLLLSALTVPHMWLEWRARLGSVGGSALSWSRAAASASSVSPAAPS